MGKDKVIIYTDGACSGNPGPGGYAAIIIEGEDINEIVGAEEKTTNNRMEMMAVIKGLESLKIAKRVSVYSDSAYVVNAYLQMWVNKWKRNGWKTANGDTVKNIDLWKRLDILKEQYQVEFIKVKGHSDNKYNNKCDELAVNAIKGIGKNISNNGNGNNQDENSMVIKKAFGSLPVLETNRLKLRLFKESDIDDLYEYCSDPEVTRYLTFPTYTSKEEATERMKFLLDSYADVTKPINWAIEVKENNKMIGGIDFIKWDIESNKAEIGYCLNKEYWNKGIMTEALLEVIKFGFNNMNLNRIEIKCDDRNIGSYRVMEKSGLKYEGTHREIKFSKGEYISLKVYSILKREYKAI